jgi:hypothetical protein
MNSIQNAARLLAACAIVVLWQGSAQAEVPAHLCAPERCEYAVKNWVGQYPSDSERAAGKWHCFDKDSKVAIACTFIRGDKIYSYSDVYREGTSASSRLNYCYQLCRTPAFDAFERGACEFHCRWESRQ